MLSSEVSAQYKQLQEYYLNLCRSQLSSKSDSLPPLPPVLNEPSSLNNQSDQHADELGKNIFRLLLASSSSSAANQNVSSTSSIYNNFLLQWIGNMQANSTNLPTSSSVTNGIDQYQTKNPQQQLQTYDLTRSLLGAAHTDTLSLEQKSHSI